MRFRLLRSALLLVSLGFSAGALAHPHVWITASAELVYGADGKVTAVKHRWTFDPAYSSFVSQGLDKDGDGKLSPEELSELARVNTENLAEFGYFTQLKADGAKQPFDAPVDPGMTFDNGQATLAFVLPLKSPALAKSALLLEVYDPTYFVAFSLAQGDDVVRLVGAPAGCSTSVKRPKPVQTAQDQKLTESFFSALTASADFGAQFANRILVACP